MLSYNSCKSGSALVSWLLVRLSVFNLVFNFQLFGFIFQQVHRGNVTMQIVSNFAANSAEIDELISFKILATMLNSTSGLKPAHVKLLNFSVLYMKCYSTKLCCERCAKST